MYIYIVFLEQKGHKWDNGAWALLVRSSLSIIITIIIIIIVSSSSSSIVIISSVMIVIIMILLWLMLQHQALSSHARTGALPDLQQTIQTTHNKYNITQQ